MTLKLVDTRIVQHSSESNEHYTPPAVVEAARATMGSIDLDPFSCALANEVVRAKQYYVAWGFTLGWLNGHDHNIDNGSMIGTYGTPSRALVNPPGGLVDRFTFQPAKPGSRNSMSSAAAGWAKTYQEWECGNVEQAIFVCFNLEVLRLTQHIPGVVPACAFPLCFLAERLRFWNASHAPEERGKKGQPSHPNAVVYLPKRYGIEQDPYDLERFSKAFSPLGYVRL